MARESNIPDYYHMAYPDDPADALDNLDTQPDPLRIPESPAMVGAFTDEVPEIRQQQAFDAHKFMSFYKTTPENDLSVAANNLGMDSVSSHQYKKEAIQEWERERTERFDERIEQEATPELKKLYRSEGFENHSLRLKESLFHMDNLRKEFKRLAGDVRPHVRDVHIGNLKAGLNIYKSVLGLYWFLDPSNTDVQEKIASVSNDLHILNSEGMSEGMERFERRLGDVRKRKGFFSKLSGYSREYLFRPSNYPSVAKQGWQMFGEFTPALAFGAGAGRVAAKTMGKTYGYIHNVLATANGAGAIEAGRWMDEWFDNRNLQIHNPAHLKAVADDPKMMNALIQESKTRGLTMGVTQAAITGMTFKFAPGIYSDFVKKFGVNFATVATKKAATISAEMVSEFSQEVVSRLATKGIENWTAKDWDEALQEGFAGWGSAAARASVANDYVNMRTEQIIQKIKAEQEKKSKTKTETKPKTPEVEPPTGETPEAGKPEKSLSEIVEDRGDEILKDGIPLTEKESKKRKQIREKQQEIRNILKEKHAKLLKELDEKRDEGKARTAKELKKAMGQEPDLKHLEELKKALEGSTDEELKAYIEDQIRETKKLYDLPPYILRTDEEIKKAFESVPDDVEIDIKDLDTMLKHTERYIQFYITKTFLGHFFNTEGKNISESQKEKISQNFLSRFGDIKTDDETIEDKINLLIEQVNNGNKIYMMKQIKKMYNKKNMTPEERVKGKIYANMVGFFASSNRPEKYQLSHLDVELTIRLIKGASKIMGVDMNYLADKFIFAFNHDRDAFYSSATNLVQVDPQLVSNYYDSGHFGKLFLFHETGHFVMDQIYKHYQENPNEQSKKFLEVMFKSFKDVTAMQDPKIFEQHKKMKYAKDFNKFMEYSQGALDRYAGMMQPVESVMKKRIESLEKLYQNLARFMDTSQYDIDFTGIYTAELKSMFFDLLDLSAEIDALPISAVEKLHRMGMETWQLNHLLSTTDIDFRDADEQNILAEFYGIPIEYYLDWEEDGSIPLLPPRPGFDKERKVTKPNYDFLVHTRKKLAELINDNTNLPVYIRNFKNLAKDMKDFGLDYPVFDIDFEMNPVEADRKRHVERARELRRRLGLSEADSIAQAKVDKDKRADVAGLMNEYKNALEKAAIRLNEWRIRKIADLANKVDDKYFNQYHRLLLNLFQGRLDNHPLSPKYNDVEVIIGAARILFNQKKITEKQLDYLEYMSLERQIELENKGNVFNTFHRLLQHFVSTISKDQLNYFYGQSANPSLAEQITNAEILGFEPKDKNQKGLPVPPLPDKAIEEKVFTPELPPETPSEEAVKEQNFEKGIIAEILEAFKTRAKGTAAIIFREGRKDLIRPLHLFEYLGSYNPKSKIVSLFSRLNNAYERAETAWKERSEKFLTKMFYSAYGKPHMAADPLFSTENITKPFHSPKTGYTVQGINDLAFILVNAGNTKNIAYILNSRVRMGTEMKLLRDVISDGLKREINKIPLNRRQKMLGNYRLEDDPTQAFRRILSFLREMKADRENIYTNPEFPFLLQGVLEYYNRVEDKLFGIGINIGTQVEGEQMISQGNINDDRIRRTLDAMLVGYFLQDIMSNAKNNIPSGIFRLVEQIWSEFKDIHGPLQEAREKVGRSLGEVRADLGPIIFPWLRGGGYYPIRENKAGENTSAWSPSVKSWNDEMFTKKRRFMSKSDDLPTNTNIVTLTMGSMRAMVRATNMIEDYEFVTRMIGPDSNAWSYLRAFIREEGIAVVKGWLQRTQQGTMGWDSDAANRYMKFMHNQFKTMVMFANVPVAVEQLTGVLIQTGLEIPAEVTKRVLAEWTAHPVEMFTFMNESSEVMRNMGVHKQFHLYSDLAQAIGGNIFPVMDNREAIFKMKKFIAKWKDVNVEHGLKGYAGMKLAQHGFVNSLMFNIVYRAAREGKLTYKGEPQGFTHEEAVDAANNAIISSQGVFSPPTVSNLEARPWFQFTKGFASFFVNLNGKIFNEIHRRTKINPQEGHLRQLMYLAPIVFTTVAINLPRAIMYYAMQNPDDDESDSLVTWLIYQYFDTLIATGQYTSFATIFGPSEIYRTLAHPEWAGAGFFSDKEILGLQAIGGVYALPRDIRNWWDSGSLAALPGEKKFRPGTPGQLTNRSRLFLGLLYTPAYRVHQLVDSFLLRKKKLTKTGFAENLTDFERSRVGRLLMTDYYDTLD